MKSPKACCLELIGETYRRGAAPGVWGNTAARRSEAPAPGGTVACISHRRGRPASGTWRRVVRRPLYRPVPSHVPARAGRGSSRTRGTSGGPQADVVLRVVGAIGRLGLGVEVPEAKRRSLALVAPAPPLRLALGLWRRLGVPRREAGRLLAGDGRLVRVLRAEVEAIGRRAPGARREDLR